VTAGLVAVGVGAALGAWLRWGLGTLLNPVFPVLPLGTLAANLVGGLLMGSAMELATRHTVLTPEARLFIMTGFLGGLTTFSTFSAEVVAHLLEGRLLPAVVLAGAHLAGSLVLTALGLATVKALA